MPFSCLSEIFFIQIFHQKKSSDGEFQLNQTPTLAYQMKINVSLILPSWKAECPPIVVLLIYELNIQLLWRLKQSQIQKKLKRMI